MKDLTKRAGSALKKTGEVSARLVRWTDNQISDFYAGGARPFQGKWGKLINRPGVRTGLRLKMAVTTVAAAVAAPVPVALTLAFGALLRKDVPAERKARIEADLKALDDQVPESWHEKLGVALEDNIVVRQILNGLDKVGVGSDMYWKHAPSDNERLKALLEKPGVRAALYTGLIGSFVAAPVATFTAVSCWQWFNKTNRDKCALPQIEGPEKVEAEKDAPSHSPKI